MGFCDFKDVVAFGNNQLWRPLAAKVKDHHSWLPKKWSAYVYLNHLKVPKAIPKLKKEVIKCVLITIDPSPFAVVSTKYIFLNELL